MLCVKSTAQKLYVQHDLNHNEIYINMSRGEEKKGLEVIIPKCSQ